MDEALKDDVLTYAIENGIIDLTCIQEKVIMNQRKELLKNHTNKIWKGSDGNWYTYLPDKEKGRILKKRTTQKALEDDIVCYWKEELENPTIQEVFNEWNDRRLELNKISESTHLRNFQVFKRHYSEFGKRKIKSISSEEIGDFLEEQIPKYNLTSKAFSNLKTITRGFLKRAKKRKLICFNVDELFQELDTSDTDFRKVIKEDYQEVFDETEMPIMIDYLTKNIDISNLGILLMFVTGIRIGELVALKYDDFSSNFFNIRRTETRYLDENNKYIYHIKDFPKSQAGVRTVVIPHEYEWIVQEILKGKKSGDYVFSKNGVRMTTQSIRMKLRRNCDKLHIYRKSPHKIRKTYGSILLDNNIDNRLITGQMGHTNITCTEIHYHRNRRGLENKAKIISSIPEFQSM